MRHLALVSIFACLVAGCVTAKFQEYTGQDFSRVRFALEAARGPLDQSSGHVNHQSVHVYGVSTEQCSEPFHWTFIADRQLLGTQERVLGMPLREFSRFGAHEFRVRPGEHVIFLRQSNGGFNGVSFTSASCLVPIRLDTSRGIDYEIIFEWKEEQTCKANVYQLEPGSPVTRRKISEATNVSGSQYSPACQKQMRSILTGG
jgi:hypothetical protein